MYCELTYLSYCTHAKVYSCMNQNSYTAQIFSFQILMSVWKEQTCVIRTATIPLVHITVVAILGTVSIWMGSDVMILMNVLK